MFRNISWLKYLSPVFGLLLCPVTILFLWSIYTGPKVNLQIDVIESVN